ncbi:MAG: DUF362 domain-containing protein [Candidatus Thermoplasmatota archaeon]|nr:DUF362 domain-containing protein [Candidatus Thermoplasmatota archaeon]
MASMERPKVDIRRITDDTMKKELQKSLDAIGYRDIVKPGHKVVIKVNATHFHYLPGITVTPQLVHDFVSILKERGAEVIVGEGDLQRVSADTALEGCGLKESAESAGAKVINFMKDEFVTFPLKGELFDFNEYKIPKSFVDCDVFASMPVFKTHKLTGVTLTLKNHFGCVPDDLRLKYHGQIDKARADFCLLLKPKLIVMDGRIGLESDGPIAGLPKKLGLLLTSTNAVAADSVACRIMEHDPSKIKHIMTAHRRGCGPIETKEMELSGERIEDVKTPFEPANLDTISNLEKWISPHPHLSHLVYRTFFTPAKWVSWRYRSMTGYKKEYIKRIKERGLWEDYEHLFK